MKNMNQLREILCDTIDRLMAEDISPKEGNAIINAAGKYLFSIKLELDYAKLKGGKPVLLALEVQRLTKVTTAASKAA